MNVEKTFDPDAINLISHHILSAYLLLRKRLLPVDAIQSAHGLPFSYIQTLSALDEKGELSVSEISARLGIGKSNITPMINQLIAHQYVERVKGKADKRVVNIILLEKGHEKFLSIQQTICTQIAKIAEGISAAELQDLADSLQRISRILSSHG